MANILDIIPYKILPVQNGGQKAIFIFCKCLAAENTLAAVSTENNEMDRVLTFSLLPFFKTTRFRYINPFYYFKLRKIIKSREIEYVITEHPYMAWLGYLLKITLGIHWYIRSHNIEYKRFRELKKWWWWLLKVYEKWAYKKADKTLFITGEDAHFAVTQLGVSSKKTEVISFGIEMQSIPGDVGASREYVYQKHGIPPQTWLLLFNGDLSYAPNYEAVDFIVNQINPLLLKQGLTGYRIIFCGKGLPGKFNELKGHVDKNIIYAGFVTHIEPYFKAAHIFLNPVVSGGGIKTKLVEAIGFNNTVISSVTGAIGVSPALCGRKLIIVPDSDAPAFAEAIPIALQKFNDTPPAWYEYFYWENIAGRMQHLFA